MVRTFTVVILSALLGMGTAAVAQSARPPVQRDTQDFAIATCLAAQREPVIREQGGKWADAIVQRSRGDISVLTMIAKAVAAELQRHPMAIGRDDRTGKDQPLPLLRCGEIIDVPAIRTAIGMAQAAMAGDYRGKPVSW